MWTTPLCGLASDGASMCAKCSAHRITTSKPSFSLHPLRVQVVACPCASHARVTFTLHTLDDNRCARQKKTIYFFLGAMPPNSEFISFVKKFIRLFICLSFFVPPVKPPLPPAPSIEPKPPNPEPDGFSAESLPAAAAGWAGAATAFAFSRIANMVMCLLELECGGERRNRIFLHV